MTAKLEVVISETENVMDIEIKGEGIGCSPREKAHLVAMIATLQAIMDDLNKPTPGCNCPACKGKREVGRERQNMH